MIRIGTRDSKLAVWQAMQVQQQLDALGFQSELVYIKSEGDIDLKTPIYAMGVQGVFTRSLDIALLNDRIDIAVHSMKDVPVQLPEGLIQCAVLLRGAVNDLLVFKNEEKSVSFQYRKNNTLNNLSPFSIATSSIRRRAQWLHRFPNDTLQGIRGNVITRLQKLQAEALDAVIFAQAGLERINARPEQSEILEWMLPAPAQGAIMVVCRRDDDPVYNACALLNDPDTDLCTKIERDFLKALLGGCSTPISALATVKNDHVHFKGNIFSLNGKEKAEIEKAVLIKDANDLGMIAATDLLQNGGQAIADAIRNEK